ncbi:iron permease [Irpex rosettiformis]|uniref:Iron permease n=1 Tax=Irpex rosettiformis TaxID=378272 RepID=A0ACB8TMB1_9APHY|nr:iron permease [Irpex rosettiformis]
MTEQAPSPAESEALVPLHLLAKEAPVSVETESAKSGTGKDAEFSWTNRSFGFWMIIAANFTSDFLSAFDMSVVSTALPTIVQDLGGNDFIWVGSAYALAGSAIVPLCGGLVSIWGRKPILLILMTLFAIGSAVAGSAKSMNVLIVGRAFQGFGGCGALTVTEIIYADIIPLPQRGIMQGMASVVWAFATGIGPPLGGILANAGAWRWLFYLNLPIFGIAAALEIVFLHNTPPEATVRQKLRRMDWTGSAIVVGGSAAFILALSWGGIRFAWSDSQTLVPLIIGIVALLSFMFYERFCAKEPIVPWSVFATRSSIMGYIGTSIHGLVMYVAIYYLPVYYQAVKLASTIRSGVYMLGFSMFITPAAMVCGVSFMVFNRYLPQNYVGWVLMVAGSGVLAVLGVDSSKAAIISAPIMLGMGVGMGWTMTQFPILASLPYSNNAHALSFFTFVRNLSQTMGVAIGGSILQNLLTHKLPASYIAQLPSGVSFAYSAIPTLNSLDPATQFLVRKAFADSLKLMWLVMIGISGIGLVSVFFMKEIPMRHDLDEQWALEQKEKKNTQAQGGGETVSG